jgi:hypothetical protein
VRPLGWLRRLLRRPAPLPRAYRPAEWPMVDISQPILADMVDRFEHSVA